MNFDQLLLTELEFQLIKDYIYKVCGINLNDSKKQLVQARLRKRLAHYNLPTFKAYYEFVQSPDGQKQELGTFVNCLTTNKTDFYREKHHFDYLMDVIFPEMIAKSASGLGSRKIRVWHAGCSTGEEPYTMAITVGECFGNRPGWDVKLFATDIDTNVLNSAKEGEYDSGRLSPVPKDLLRKYFLRSSVKDDVYKAKQLIRNMITFRQINLLDDPWPIRSETMFDIIFCRNVIIYFDKQTQRRLISRFASRLRPGGYLFLGHSESLFGVSEGFISCGNTIFRLPEYGARAA